MKTRLALFAAALLLLPALALLLAGDEWQPSGPISGKVTLPLLCGSLALAIFSLLLDAHTRRRSGSSLISTQRGYLLWNAAAGALAAMLLAYLNLYTASWSSPAGSIAEMLILSAMLGAALQPAVLIARLWLAGFTGLTRSLTRLPALPDLAAETAVPLLLALSFVGLLGGAVWPARLFWLTWLAPLLLLAGLQLLWDESTVFSGLKRGDWSRVVLGGGAGVLLGGLAFAAYALAGGALKLNLPVALVPLLLFAFGLLCLQLADIIAEHWRGKPLTQIYQAKKPFPIQIVVKKAP